MEGARRIPAMPHVPALDGARGLAVAGVLLFHGGHLRGGYLGVDFFFTLSGFLITSLLLAESQRTGTITLSAFWARRARRLLPALGVLMLGVALYSIVLAKPTELAQIRGDAFATLAYVANWHSIFSHQSYFALFAAPSPLNHTWSLAIEEQFYLVWPLVVVALLTRWKRHAAQAVLVASLTLAAGSSALMIALYNPANTNRVYFGTDTRAAAILFGAALAAALAIYGPAKQRAARIAIETAGVVAACGLGTAWARLDGNSAFLYRGGFLLCGLAGTAVIAAAMHSQQTVGPVGRALSFKPLCALGLVSYGVYLYHWPIDIALNRPHVSLHGWPLFTVQTIVTLALAAASYKVIEQPIRRGALSTMQLRRLAPVVAVGLVLVLFAATARTPATDPTVASAGKVTPRNWLDAADRAAELAPPRSTRILVVGDSVGSLLAEAMKKIDTDPPLAVFNIAIFGCKFLPFALGPSGVTSARYHGNYGVVTNPSESSCRRPLEPTIVQRFHPDIVYWIVSNPVDAVLSPADGWLDTCSARFASLSRSSLTAELAVLGSSGAKVVLTTEVYPRNHVSAEDRPTDCENAVRRQVATATGTQLIDLQGFVCPGGRCLAKKDGVTLRADGEHFEGPGAELVARWLYDQAR